MSSSILEAMIIASFTGGNILKKYFEKENLSVLQKSVSYDLVTNIDIESQEEINSILTKRFPDIPVVEKRTASKPEGNPGHSMSILWMGLLILFINIPSSLCL